MTIDNQALKAVGGVIVASVMIVALGVAAFGQANGHDHSKHSHGGAPVTTPIETPHATVAPDVAAEMNGDTDKVDMAGGIKMVAPQKGLTGLVGEGQGNGCLEDYGDPGQCLPVLSPAQQAMPDMDHPWTCAEVRQLFPQGVSVHGEDTLGLDKDENRTACDEGDG